jgi:hypothetical protein
MKMTKSQLEQINNMTTNYAKFNTKVNILGVDDKDNIIDEFVIRILYTLYIHPINVRNSPITTSNIVDTIQWVRIITIYPSDSHHSIFLP